MTFALADRSRVDLPALSQVQGAFNLQTSGEFNCSQFNDANKNHVIKGEYNCAGSQTKPGTAGTKPSSTGSGAKGTNAASPLDLQLSLVMGSSSLVATILQLFL